jgi:hypothetical protein
MHGAMQAGSIVITHANGSEQQLELGEGTVYVGSAPDCDLVLDGAEIAPHHAAMRAARPSPGQPLARGRDAGDAGAGAGRARRLANDREPRTENDQLSVLSRQF